MKPLIATPCYGAMVCLNYVISVLRLRTAFWQLDIAHDFYLVAGESLVTRARNDCVAYFRTGDWTHLFWIDADIGFEPASAIRLLNAGRGVVAGIYPRKGDHAGFPIDLEAIRNPDEHGFSEVNEAPTGFMCIARSVFDRLSEAGTGRHELFDSMRVGDEYLSEDYAFCRRWRAIGGKVYADMRCDLTHQGIKLYSDGFSAVIRELNL